jgi:hypothetical protein
MINYLRKIAIFGQEHAKEQYDEFKRNLGSNKDRMLVFFSHDRVYTRSVLGGEENLDGIIDDIHTKFDNIYQEYINKVHFTAFTKMDLRREVVEKQIIPELEKEGYKFEEVKESQLNFKIAWPDTLIYSVAHPSFKGNIIKSSLTRTAIFGQEYAKDQYDANAALLDGILDPEVDKNNWNEEEDGYVSDKFKGWKVIHMYNPGQYGGTEGAFFRLIVDHSGRWVRIYFGRGGLHSISNGSFRLMNIDKNKKEIHYTNTSEAYKWDEAK